MPSDLTSYLAANYLIADPPKSKSQSKKRKCKQNAGLLITEDDATGWAANDKKDEHEDNLPVTIAGTSTDFRKAKRSNWKIISGGAKPAPPSTGQDAEAAAADAIIASVAAEAKARRDGEDQAPVVEDVDVDFGNDKPSVQRMTDGTLAGLQSAAAVADQLKRQKQKEQEEWERERAAAAGGQGKEQTGYRDAAGHRIDAALQRQAARRALAEKEEKERQALDALKGDVQLEEAKLRRQRLADAKHMALARKADDEEMNRELKEQQRWNDPMAQFMTQLNTTAWGKKNKRKGKPVYVGPAPPNRYGIRPGYRWDGVDRGNGFENERFKVLNRRERNKGLEYAWQMDE